MAGTEGSKIHSAADLAAWNRDYADIALPPEFPSQELIERSIAYENKPQKRHESLEHVLKMGRSFSAVLEKHDLDVIIGPADSKFRIYSAVAG